MHKRLLYTIVLAIVLLLSVVSVQAADTPSLEEDVEELPAKAIAYRYWIDDNVNDKTTKACNGTDVQQVFDISSLNTGSHIYHVQFKSEEGGWSAAQNIAFYISNNNDDVKDEDAAAPVTQYEYWINNSNKSSVYQYNQADITIEASTAGLPEGKNSYQICATDSKGRKSFYDGSFYTIDSSSTDDEEIEQPAKAVSYRYWLDEDVNNKQEVEINNTAEFTCNVDITNLTQGAHTCHFELKDNSGRWYAGNDVFFYAGNINQDVVEEAVPIAKFEYWFDTRDKQTLAEFTQAEFSIEKNLTEFSAGQHTYTLSAIDDNGMRSFIEGNFLCFDVNIDDQEEVPTTVDCYQYWLDDDKEHATTVAYTTDDISTLIDVNNVSGGAHTFNLRIKDSDNIWGATQQFVFYAPGTTETADPSKEQQDIIGYRYGTNGITKEKILTEVSSITALTEEIDFPKLSSISDVEKYRFSFSEENKVNVERELNMTYFIQFKNKLGEWGEPAYCDSTSIEDFTRTAHDLALQRTMGVQKQDDGDFAIVKFDIPAANAYYLSTANSCNILLYKDGSQLNKLEAKDVTDETKSSYFQEGTYYAIIYNQKEDGSIRLASSANYLPVPVLSYTNQQLTATCTEADAKIYYTLDGSVPTAESTLYDGPIQMNYNCVVKAIALLDGHADSHIAKYEVSDFETQTCNIPSFSYDGKKVTLTSTTTNASIYYTTDGTTPVAGISKKYTEDGIDVKNLCSIMAIATKDLMNNSEVAIYEIPAYYDGKSQVEVQTAGSLSKAFEWNNGEVVSDTLQVLGNINTNDVASLKAMLGIKYLDLNKVNVDGKTLPDQAFANMNLRTVSLPATLTSCGSGLFSGNRQLAAVVWNANTNMPAEVLSGIDNPNILLYVNTKSYAPASFNNVVVGNIADNIVLAEPSAEQTSSGNFFVPQAFTAKKISYTRDFKQATEIGVCQGWETIALPFDVQTITHETNGIIAPFAKGDKEAKPFWLYELAPNGGFQATATIKANTPYIISMPNSQAYSDEYILGGKVTFSASDVNIEASGSSSTRNNSREFATSFEQVPAQDGIYALNVGTEYQGYRPGSIFAENFMVVKPFEAYLTTAEAAQAFSLKFGGGTTGIENIPVKEINGVKAWANGSTLYIQSDKARKVQVFSTMGILMKTIETEAGETATVTDLPAGIYIVNNKKVAVK